MSHQRTRTAIVAAAVSLVIVVSSPAYAQGFGVRGGANVNPDQFAVGAHYDFAPLTDALWLRPNGDLGFGSGTRLFAVNLEAAYRLPLLEWKSPWTAYAGGGPSINWYRVAGVTDTQTGFNAMFGLAHVRGLFTEARVGFYDSPEFRVAVGYAFKSGIPRANKPASPAPRSGRRR